MFATFRAEQNRSNPMVIYRQRPPEKEALAPAACLNPPAVVPHGLGVGDGSLQIKPGRQAARTSQVSGTRSLAACLESWLCFCCSIQSTRWPHYRGQRSGRHSGCAHSTACSVQPSGVHEREERTSLQRRYSRVLRAGVLDPVIHARDMLPPESIVTGGSLAKGSKIGYELTCACLHSKFFSLRCLHKRISISRGLLRLFLLTSYVQSKGEVEQNKYS